MNNLQLNTKGLNFKKVPKTNKSFHLSMDNLDMLELLADSNSRSVSAILDELLNHIFKLEKEVLDYEKYN